MSRRKKKETTSSQAKALGFTPLTGIFGAAGIAVVALGYLLLSRGDITAAPLLLVLGYLVLLPAALVK